MSIESGIMMVQCPTCSGMSGMPPCYTCNGSGVVKALQQESEGVMNDLKAQLADVEQMNHSLQKRIMELESESVVVETNACYIFNLGDVAKHFKPNDRVRVVVTRIQYGDDPAYDSAANKGVENE